MNRDFFFILLCCFVVLGGCSNFKRSGQSSENPVATETESITDKKWRLTEVAGDPVPEEINGKMPHIYLSGQDNRVSGNGGCNALSGSFSLSGDHGIQFGQMVATRMACLDMETETKLLTALQETDNYTVGAGVLTLSKGQGTPLARFQLAE